MKFTIEKGAALDAMAAVFAVVSRKTTIPILWNLRIEAHDDQLFITATDLDMQATVTVEAQVSEPGLITIDADKFNSIAKAIPDGADLTLETVGDDSRASVKSGRSNFKVLMLPGADFPVMAPGERGESFTITAKDFARLLDIGAFCAGIAEPRDYLNCGYLHTVNGKLRVVSTEGHRLSYCEIDAPAGLVLDPGGMLPGKVVAMTRRLIGLLSPDAEISVFVTQEKFSAELGATTLIAKMLSGNYPPYLRVIPTDIIGTFVADTDLFLGALRRVLIMMDLKLLTVVADLTEGMMTLHAQGAETGAASESLEVEWSGPDHQFKVNGPWLLDLLTRVATENVIMKVSADKRGMPISETGEPDWFGMISPQGVEKGG